MRLILSAATLFLTGLFWLVAGALPVASDHNFPPLLPLVPNTPLMQQIKANQSYTYCLNSTASSYPAFRSQLEDVVARYEERTGIRAQEVPYGAGCQVQHNMIQGLQCGGCAGQIYYANAFPVPIQYAAQLAYVDWRTTMGHELGHGVLGLHEQYDDRAFACKGQQFTVMDCASGVRYPQPFDVTNGCGALATAWCGRAPEPPDPLCMDGICVFKSGWVYRVNGDSWTDQYGRIAFEARDSNGFRYSPVNQTYEPSGKELARGEWGRITVP